MDRPLILVTNDDGIDSFGIAALVEVAKKFGEVVVVAPDSHQSGMSHAITMDKPLRLVEVPIFDGVKAYKCSGTPVDCVKIALNKVFDKLPDLCISGINHGSNASINVVYSGTMAAAMEAAINGINSIGFSLLNFNANADMNTSKFVAEKIIAESLNKGMLDANLLNVNIPNVGIEQLKGFKICRQAVGNWQEEFEHRIDTFKRDYYWIAGKYVYKDSGDDNDIWALQHNYVSIVPVTYNLTAKKSIQGLQENWNLSSSALTTNK